MRYADAIHFIYNLELFGIKMGLENIAKMLRRLGNPERAFRSIHVAGTNGKGSVSSMLFSILKEAGYKTGVFTSPHLVDFRERIRTNAGVIDKRSLTQFVEQHEEFIRQEKITFFEISTALAFWHFRQMGVEIAVVEVGLGGRLDATNIVQPILSVITQIDFDHTRILGGSLEKIAYEKAGIIKPGIPLVTGERREEICQLFESICQVRNTTLSSAAEAPDRFLCRANQMVFEMHRNGSSKMKLLSPLVGPHQLRNISVVTSSLELLDQQGINISNRAFIDGVRNCRWPARFQMISQRPTILLDVAHNPAGMDQLVKTFRLAYPGKKATVLFGVLDRPDYDQMLRSLKKITRKMVISRPNYWRGADLAGVKVAAEEAGLGVQMEPKVNDGVDRVLQWVNLDDTLLICGSHFIVGEAILRLYEHRRRGELPHLSADITYIHE